MPFRFKVPYSKHWVFTDYFDAHKLFVLIFQKLLLGSDFIVLLIFSAQVSVLRPKRLCLATALISDEYLVWKYERTKTTVDYVHCFALSTYRPAQNMECFIIVIGTKSAKYR